MFYYYFINHLENILLKINENERIHKFLYHINFQNNIVKYKKCISDFINKNELLLKNELTFIQQPIDDYESHLYTIQIDAYLILEQIKFPVKFFEILEYSFIQLILETFACPFQILLNHLEEDQILLIFQCENDFFYMVWESNLKLKILANKYYSNKITFIYSKNKKYDFIEEIPISICNSLDKIIPYLKQTVFFLFNINKSIMNNELNKIFSVKGSNKITIHSSLLYFNNKSHLKTNQNLKDYEFEKTSQYQTIIKCFLIKELLIKEKNYIQYVAPKLLSKLPFIRVSTHAFYENTPHYYKIINNKEIFDNYVKSLPEYIYWESQLILFTHGKQYIDIYLFLFKYNKITNYKIIKIQKKNNFLNNKISKFIKIFLMKKFLPFYLNQRNLEDFFCIKKYIEFINSKIIIYLNNKQDYPIKKKVNLQNFSFCQINK